ncbi:MAG: hypothetical protein ACE5FY_05310, partial [Nitrospiria bacterium]
KQTANKTRSLRHYIETVLTVIIWLFSIAFIVVTAQQMIRELNAVSVFKESISFYGLGLPLISVMTVSWSFFRLFLYKQCISQNIKISTKARTDELVEMVKLFKLSPEQVDEMRKSACIKVQFQTAGVTATFPVTLLKELRR